MLAPLIFMDQPLVIQPGAITDSSQTLIQQSSGHLSGLTRLVVLFALFAGKLF